MADVKIYDWDDEIEYDGEMKEFVILEDGNYDFEVTKYERGHYTPSANAITPPCNMITITSKVSTDKGDAFVKDTFPLASTMDWKLDAFFKSIGLKKHGDKKFKMKWDEAVGCKGRAFIVKTKGSKDGVYFNNIDHYLLPLAKAKTSEKEEGDVDWE